MATYLPTSATRTAGLGAWMRATIRRQSARSGGAALIPSSSTM